MEQHRITSVLVVDERRAAGRRAELQRPDAREGHLMAAGIAVRRPRLLLKAQAPGAGSRKAAIFDVDGVLTDGRLYIGEHGEIVQGLPHARRSRPEAAGAGRHHAAGDHRSRLAGGAQARSRPRHLRMRVYGAAGQAGRGHRAAAALGLDWARRGRDRRRLARPAVDDARAFACAPANAHVEVRASRTTSRRPRGGHGAAREFCDLLLMAAGRYAALLRGDQATLDAI